MKTAIPILLCIVCSLGCDKGPQLVPIEGTVLYKGHPLEYGSVMFQPVGIDNAQTARGPIQPDGSFTLTTNTDGDGVMLGKCQVRITAFEAQRTNAQGSKQKELALGKSAIPRRFQNFGSSGIEYTITQDIQLPLVIDLDAIE